MINKNRKSGKKPASFICILLAGSSLATMPSAAMAADDQAVTASEILVTTARKKEESVLDTPIAITGMTGEELSEKGVTTFGDLAQQTPGFSMNNNYSGRADRSYAQLIIRGFTSSSPSVSTASMFIDGVPVSSATAISSINNPARVEILKGPQPAYFGRQAFAGAINVVNREPGDELAGKVEATLGTRNNYEIYGEIEAPIIEDVLGIRLTGDKWSKDGGYTNSYNGSTFGDQSSESYSAFVTFTPTESLKIRGFGMYSHDDDGPAASTIVSAYTVTGTDGSTVIPGQSNCTLTGYTKTVQGTGTTIQNPWFCGVAPKLGHSLSANTNVDATVQDYLDASKSKSFMGDDMIDHFGLVRNFYHGHLNVDYDIGDSGLTLSSLTGFNHEEWGTLLDSDNMGSEVLAGGSAQRGFFDYTYLAETQNKDFSQELRLSYDSGPLNAMLGASYLKASSQAAGGGGAIPAASAVFKRRGKTENETKGIFGELSYSFDSGLSLSAEGRVQWDTLSSYAGEGGVTVTNSEVLPAGFYEDGSQLLKKTYVNFMPRAIISYNFPGSDLMAYASWSKAVNPGAFNSSFLTYTQDAVDAAIAAGVRVEVKPEKVTNYEVGLKGTALNGAMTFSSALYYAQWRDQINTIAVASGTQLLAATANTGSVNLWGLELEGNLKVNDIVTLSAGGAISDTNIQEYSYPLTSQLTGVWDFSGNEMPNTSKYSAVASINLEDALSSTSDATWFMRADYSFKSGVYSNAANVTRAPNRSQVNLRGGVSFGKARIEAFVKNVFDNKQYVSVYDNYVITGNYAYFGYNSALAVGFPERRTAGVKVSVGF